MSINRFNSSLSWIIKLLLIGFAVFFITKECFQICIVRGESMNPTLNNKQFVIIKKFNLDLKYQDIVVIKKDNKIIIKRLIGIPNDKIRIDEYLYINDKKIENYKIENKGEITEEISLKSNEYFVLGDNLNNSIDSRFSEIGIIKEEEIIGKIIIM